MKRTFAAACFAAIALLAPSAASAAPGELDPILEVGPPGAVGTVHAGESFSNDVAGNSSIDPDRAADANDSVRIGSITKPMVATVVLQLVDEGKVGLDDTIDQYVPGVVPNDDVITVRDLLQHTSGIPEYATKLYADPNYFEANRNTKFTPEELVNVAIAGEPAQTEPGTWSYSNANYLLAGMIVERTTGQPVSEELRHRIFLPSGMNNSILRNEDPVISGPHMSGYIVATSTGEPPYDSTQYTPTLTGAAGAVISTTGDVTRFFDALFDGELLSDASMKEMTTTVPIAGGGGYGLGIMSIPMPCAPGGVMWGHDGAVFGYMSLAMATADGDRQVAVSANAYTEDLAGVSAAMAPYVANNICTPAG